MPSTLDKVKKIHIIINPASGRFEPILPVINAVLKNTQIEWDVSITKKAHHACLLAREAAKKNYDLIAVYGGDGTIMEVISGMLCSGIPLAILPGGTAMSWQPIWGSPKTLKKPVN